MRPTLVRDSGGEAEDDGGPLDESQLLAGLRSGSSAAVTEFSNHFRQMLLDHARRLRVPPTDRDTTVESFLDDMALHLASMRPPRSLTAYVVQSFRNTVLLQRRRSALEDEHQVDHSDEVGGVHLVRETCSTYTVRAVLGDAEVGPQPVIAALAKHLTASLSETELRVLTWRSYRVPVRQIAEWLGISYGAARVRVSRLSARPLDEALRYRDTLDTRDQSVLNHFLRRAGLIPDPADPSQEDA